MSHTAVWHLANAVRTHEPLRYALGVDELTDRTDWRAIVSPERLASMSGGEASLVLAAAHIADVHVESSVTFGSLFIDLDPEDQVILAGVLSAIAQENMDETTAVRKRLGLIS